MDNSKRSPEGPHPRQKRRTRSAGVSGTAGASRTAAGSGTAGGSRTAGALPPRRTRRSGGKQASSGLPRSSLLSDLVRVVAARFVTRAPRRRGRRRRRRSTASVAVALVRKYSSQVAALVGVIIVLLSVYLIRQGIMAPTGAPYDADVSSTPEDASPSDSQTTGAGGKPGADSAEQPALPPSSPPSDTVQPASEEEESASASPAEVVPTTVGQVLAGLAAPAVGEVIRPFGFYQSVTFQDWRYHSGVDIALTTGDQVRAAASGTVTRVEGTRLEGWRVVISHGLGVTTIYGQMTATTVNEGESVSGGEPIGLAGAPGSLEADLGPHLHYEIRVQDRATDPTPYLGP